MKREHLYIYYGGIAMRKPVLTIFYQFNPWHSTIGGIQTLIKIFLKYAPNEFEVRLVGTEHKPNQTIGKWQVVEFAGKKIKFLPLFALQNDNVRSRIPTKQCTPAPRKLSYRRLCAECKPLCCKYCSHSSL